MKCPRCNDWWFPWFPCCKNAKELMAQAIPRTILNYRCSTCWFFDCRCGKAPQPKPEDGV